ncbi:hypothetical protein FocnCong_v020690 [Fusarium oxysporum f. sp. conglutinans]|nr:hypothetical protein FocnCong_v020690 [Fusarium oxysporum f. sp. conglutinans]
MPANTPSKEDGLVHRKKSDTISDSPVLRSGTLRTSTSKGTPTVPAEQCAVTPRAKHAEHAKPKSTKPQPNGDSPEEANPGFREDVAIDEFVDHRVDTDNSTVDIQVKWEGGETTWESEWTRRSRAATNLDIYHAFNILKRTAHPGKSKGDKYMYQVQWVGYRAADSTWEQESKLRKIAPSELEKFEAKQLASGASTEKRKTTRGPGRPRKNPRVGD